MWKIDPKNKYIQRNKYDHMHLYIYNMFVIVELLYGTWEKRKRKRE
jgi:hypothetical protein